MGRHFALHTPNPGLVPSRTIPEILKAPAHTPHLGCIDELVSQALSDGLNVPEGSLTGTRAQEPDGLETQRQKSAKPQQMLSDVRLPTVETRHRRVCYAGQSHQQICRCHGAGCRSGTSSRSNSGTTWFPKTLPCHPAPALN